MPNDIGFQREKFWLNYTVAGIKTPAYMVYELTRPQPDGAALNTAQTAFLLPKDVEFFGGELFVHNNYPNAVWWSCGFHVLDKEGGTQIPTTNPKVRTGGGPTQPVASGDYAGVGYTMLRKGDPWAYQAEDLPLGASVFMQITVSAYDAADCKHALADDYPLNNQIGIWLKRVP
jgi:hypothetical protein